MFCCVVLAVPGQFPVIIINSNVWGRASDGEWECSTFYIESSSLCSSSLSMRSWDKKQKLLEWASETYIELGFGAVVDSFSKYSLSIYHVPGTSFSAVGIPWWTQQIRPFLLWRWHGLIGRATFYSHCLDFQWSTIIYLRGCSLWVSATCLETSPYKHVSFLRYRKGLYTVSLYDQGRENFLQVI